MGEGRDRAHGGTASWMAVQQGLGSGCGRGLGGGVEGTLGKETARGME